DLAYIGLQRQPLFRFGVAPNKLIDYMMAARPVLYAIESGNDLVTESGCGVAVRAEDAAAAAQGVRSMLAMDAEQRKTMGQRGKKFVLDNLTYPVLGERFLKACA
ncbi:MAG: glycosyltransferase, partial [Telluria sp.]